MFILDTNVISESLKPQPDRNVMAWLNDGQRVRPYITTVSIAEIASGANKIFLRTGSEKFLIWLSALTREFADRLLAFDLASAQVYGRLFAERARMGMPIMPHDAMIAAVTLANGGVLATRNVRDFQGIALEVVNPFEQSA